MLSGPGFPGSLWEMDLSFPLLTLAIRPQPLAFHDLEMPPCVRVEAFLCDGLVLVPPVEGGIGRWQRKML